MLKRMRLLLFGCLFLALWTVSAGSAFAQQNSASVYEQGQVTKIEQQGENQIDGQENPFQIIDVHMTSGPDSGKTVRIQSGVQTSITKSQEVKTGESIVILKTAASDGSWTYQVYDNYRIPSLIWISALFVIFVIVMAQRKGFGSLVGLTVSLAVIFLFIVPRMLSGNDPLTTAIIGSFAILLVSTYLAHGISRQTTVALIGTLLALLLAALFAYVFVGQANLTGLNDETATLQFGQTVAVNLKGLLLGGIIIGTLGALNDVTTTQAAAVFELAQTDTALTFKKLFVKGFSIGREHMVSLVNTLVLAYAGSSLALFLFLVLNQQKLPFWVIINSEDISDELIRTIAGSMGLILVVPIVTLLAAFACSPELKGYSKKLKQGNW